MKKLCKHHSQWSRRDYFIEEHYQQYEHKQLADLLASRNAKKYTVLTNLQYQQDLLPNKMHVQFSKRNYLHFNAATTMNTALVDNDNPFPACMNHTD